MLSIKMKGLNKLKALQNWFLPSACVLCGTHSQRSLALCQACENDLPLLTEACIRCAEPLSTPLPVLPPQGGKEPMQLGQVCGSCLQNPPHFQTTLGLLVYQKPVDRLIRGLKFNNKLVYGRVLGELFIKYYKERISLFPQCIIPVPLHPHRLRERGYNQALELAKPIAKGLGIPLDKESCKRIKPTCAQMDLPADQRKNNVKDAFFVDKKLTARHVALVDDVITTGHTIAELSRALFQAGVMQIDVWCMARTAQKKGEVEASP